MACGNGSYRVGISAICRVALQFDGCITADLRWTTKTAEIAFSNYYGFVDCYTADDNTLAMENVQGVWKITRETVTKGRGY